MVEWTRTTIESPNESDERLLADALHWIWSWHLQLGRLRESTRAEYSGPAGCDRRRIYSAASYDEHMLTVAGWNMARAVKKAARQFPELDIDRENFTALRLLRHIYEHWDSDRKSHSSRSEYEKKYPDGRAFSITYGPDDWVLGGVVKLAELTESLRVLEQQMDELQRSVRKARKGENSG